MTARTRLSPHGQNSARRLRDPPRGACAAFATRQAEPAPEDIVNMDISLPQQPRALRPLCAYSSRTHSAEPLVTGGARFATPPRLVTA